MEEKKEIFEDKNESEEIVDDIIYDESESVQDIVKKLKLKIKEVQKEKDEYLNSWQRERADFVNFKKEEDVRAVRIRSLVKENMLESLLPVLDSFSVAFSNREAWEKVDENWRIGVTYIHQQFLQVLNENGISEIDPKIGDMFDPKLHQSIEDKETDNMNHKGSIIQVIQKGYKINDYVVRPARVVTGK